MPRTTALQESEKDKKDKESKKSTGAMLDPAGLLQGVPRSGGDILILFLFLFYAISFPAR